MNRLGRFIATGCYCGYAPVAPGTVGTIPAVALALVLARVAEASVAAYCAAVLVIIVIAVWAADVYEREAGVTDPRQIVVDEIAGYLLAVAFVPLSWPVVIASFLIFRLFDIVKPPPVRQLERLHGGFGVVIDDLAAGLLTNATVRILLALGLLRAF